MLKHSGKHLNTGNREKEKQHEHRGLDRKTDMSETKICTQCGLELPVTNYAKRCNAADGLRYDCKDCNSAYREAHKEHIGAYKEAHREKHLEYNRAYKAARKEALLKQSKTWRDNNKDRNRKTHATWSKNHPAVTSVHGQTRRAKKAGVASTLTPVHWKHILSEFNNTCAYCGEGDKTLHQEHFIPVLSGGEYTHDNIIPACGHCNASKGAKDFFTWYPTSEHYDKQREKKIMRFLHYTGAAQQLTLCP